MLNDYVAWVKTLIARKAMAKQRPCATRRKRCSICIFSVCLWKASEETSSLKCAEQQCASSKDLPRTSLLCHGLEDTLAVEVFLGLGILYQLPRPTLSILRCRLLDGAPLQELCNSAGSILCFWSRVCRVAL